MDILILSILPPGGGQGPRIAREEGRRKRLAISDAPAQRRRDERAGRRRARGHAVGLGGEDRAVDGRGPGRGRRGAGDSDNSQGADK